MKYIPYRTFQVSSPTGEQQMNTGDLLAILAQANDGRGLTTDDIILLSDVRQRLKSRAADKSEKIALENAEHQALEKKLSQVRWPLSGDDVAEFIRDLRKPAEQAS